jgi:RNA polymerase sigma-70 factor (ECF subfamily)
MSDLKQSEVVGQLLEARERFVRFLIPRMGSREAAEDLVQSCLVKVLQTEAQPKEAESTVAWFYRLLRNARVDHIRAEVAELKAVDRHSQEHPMLEPAPELERVACGCIPAILSTLKPADQGLLRALDMEGGSLSATAARQGISANAMGVRLHRARKTLRERVHRTCGACASHGCGDCRCGSTPAPKKSR